MLTFCNELVMFVYIKLQIKRLTAMYTVNEQGQLNVYPTEVALYYAEYPSPKQQRRYTFWGAIAVLFVTTVLVTAFSVG